MSTRYFALIVGIMFLLAGILGFIPTFVAPPIDESIALAVDQGYGSLLGLFPINILHNIVHLTVGILGIVSFGSHKNARIFSQGLAIFYGALAIMGFIPGLNSTFGLIPIYSNDIWLHALTALLATYFGFKQPDEQTMAGETQKDYSGSGVPNQSNTL